LARLVKNACEDFVGKFRAKDVESSPHLWIQHGFGEGGSKRLGLLGPTTQRFDQRPDEAGALGEITVISARARRNPTISRKIVQWRAIQNKIVNPYVIEIII